jgi:hypothetical protein
VPAGAVQEFVPVPLNATKQYPLLDEKTTFASEFAVDMQDPLPIDAAVAGGAVKSIKEEIRDAESKVDSSLRVI